MEETIPQEFLLSPELFESAFCSSELPKNLAKTALEGRLQNIRNRFII